MKRALMLAALVCACALLVSVGQLTRRPDWTAAAAQTVPQEVQVDKLQDNLYVLRGGGGNTAAFVTSAGVVLVDTKLPGWGRKVLDKLKEITDKPVTTIINTHTHIDHVGGNVEFPETVEVIAHENTSRWMKDMRPVTGGPEQQNVFRENDGRGLPKQVFQERVALGSGRDRIELHYFGRAHTGGDAWVVFPELRVLHAGDVFATKGIPIIDANNGGSGVEYPKTIAAAASALTRIETVIAGHHATTLTMADLKTYGEFVGDFVRTVQAAKKAGRTIEEVVETWRIPERFLRDGYLTPEEYQQLARQPMSARVRANVEVVWHETK